MSSKTKRLGTLADIYQNENLDGSIANLRLDRLQPSTEQPRHNRTIGVDELASSLKKDGLLSPIVVKKEGEGYRIIAGERRFHAARKIGWEHVECRIISREEQDYWRIAIIENLQRENLNAPEEARALLRLKKQDDLSDAKLAELVGKSRNYITEILGIAQLPQEVITKCEKSGLQQRNMLIQVVQAWRNKQLENFLQSYDSGNINTIRQAREFNQNAKSKRRTPSEKIESNEINDKENTQSHTPRITIQNNKIIIQCHDSAKARKLSEEIKQWLK